MRHVARARAAMFICDSCLKSSSCVAVREVKMSLSSGVIQEPIVKHDEPTELLFGRKNESTVRAGLYVVLFLTSSACLEDSDSTAEGLRCVYLMMKWSP